jgi:eukaryotic-like serine/threonine-protein kinase
MIGTKLAHYEITHHLGSGGMGDVYQALDSKLGRSVAIKFLPEAFSHDSERVARFEREARLLASLNHANIAGIHGLEQIDGRHFLVMELVLGETLADRLQHGAIPVEEALPIAKQIAEALEEAHDKGVVHRDLKPANIKITAEGKVKVLDFGLAKAYERETTNVSRSHSPTISMAATNAGLILGTAAYMSPEQAAAKPLDRRTDIWSFGVVFWEMLTGQRLFDGETLSHTLADVLRAPIDFGKLPRATAPAIRELMQRCLDRDTRSRLRDIGEARVVLEKTIANPTASAAIATTQTTAKTSSRRVIVAWAVAFIAIVGAAALAFVHFRERPPVAPLIRFQIFSPAQTTFATTGVLSPDGRRLAFEGPGPDGRPMLWVRPLDALDSRALPGTEGAIAGPIWSPDSRFLAFGVNGFPGRLKKVDVSGGPPQTLCEYNGGYREGAWSPEGVILFGAASTGLIRVSETGGMASPVTKIDAARQEIQHAGPTFLPDGRHFLYHRASNIPGNTGIYLGTLDAAPESQSTERLIGSDSDPHYVRASNSAGGFLVFLREGSLLAQPFDGLKLAGDVIPIAEDVGTLGTYGWVSVSNTGMMAYRTGNAIGPTVDLLWFDRTGKRLGQLGLHLNYIGAGVQLSPDGKRVVVTQTEGGLVPNMLAVRQRAWTAEVARGIFSRLNAGEGTEGSPAVSPDGRVAFSSTLNGAIGDLYWMPAGGIGAPEPLLLKSPTVKHPNDFSPDGRFLIYDDHTAQRQDLWILPLQAPPQGGERKPIPFLVTAADETFGQFSPDGKWIAYSSDESGRREVYVQGFDPNRVPAAAVGKWQLSTAGGDKPRWSPDGKELYYIAPDRKMMAVPVKLGAIVEPGLAFPLFDTKVVSFYPYDVSSDGRFLLYTPSGTEAPASSPVTILMNWEATLRRSEAP